jgi:hypothetical protein
MGKILHVLFRYLLHCLSLVIDRNHYASNGLPLRTGRARSNRRFWKGYGKAWWWRVDLQCRANAGKEDQGLPKARRRNPTSLFYQFFGDADHLGEFQKNLLTPHFAGPQSNQLSFISWVRLPRYSIHFFNGTILRNEFLPVGLRPDHPTKDREQTRNRKDQNAVC